jgi:hypothetical protein
MIAKKDGAGKSETMSVRLPKKERELLLKEAASAQIGVSDRARELMAAGRMAEGLMERMAGIEAGVVQGLEEISSEISSLRMAVAMSRGDSEELANRAADIMIAKLRESKAKGH